jgi:SAM-dependent methyltransferase
MGLYREQVLPRLLDVACGTRDLQPLRQRACQGLKGDVVEIGFGSGRNVAHYPTDVTSVAAVEPARTAWRIAGRRLDGATVPVRLAGPDGQRLPAPDDSYDAALSTWTLCTIPDPVAALLELRRVLKPGARLHFVEHGLAPDENVRRSQRRLEPVNRLVFGGCRLTRQVADLLTVAGFAIVELDTFYAKGPPRFAGATFLGVARSD